MAENMFKKLSVLVILVALVILTIFLVKPIATSIITGLILAYTFYPAYKKIFSFVKEKTISAIIVISLVVFLIFVPLWFLLPIIVKQVFDIYLMIQKLDLTGFIKIIFPSLTKTLSQDFLLSLNKFISEMASKIFSDLTNLLFDIPSLALKGVVTLFIFFFAMRDADIIEGYLKSLSPFSKKTNSELVRTFKEITDSLLYSTVIVGILQGILTGLGLYLFQIKNVLVLSVIAIILAIIPVLGAWLVWLPASIYLLISGKTFLGIGLFLYGAIIVSFVDNIVRPYIVATKTKISPAVVLIGIIGGLVVFGILGLVIGPLILAYLLLILDAYRKNKFPSLLSK